MHTEPPQRHRRDSCPRGSRGCDRCDAPGAGPWVRIDTMGAHTTMTLVIRLPAPGE